MRSLVALTAVAALLALGADSAGAARECDGLQVCVPVAGPWVVVPTGGGASRQEVQYQLSCPRRYVVGGLDAVLSHRAIDVSFLGRLGSPVNPGITTSRTVVFVASYVGTGAHGATFRPHIGCMPAAGGGARIPTSAGAFRPGEPTVRRVRQVRVRPGSATVVARCSARERLVGSAHAFGFYTRRAPDASLVASVSGSRTVSGNAVRVEVRGDAELGGVRAVVQVQAICSRTS
ncbi:MAG TPA: hypothetical protein VIG93_07925 [Gaiellaceae bacterium]